AVRIRDIARVVDTHKQVKQVQRTNAQPSLGIVVYKQASANAVATSDAAKQVLTPMNETKLPAGTHLDVVWDVAPYITNSVSDVQHELLLAVLLTGLVLLVFLHTFRST